MTLLGVGAAAPVPDTSVPVRTTFGIDSDWVVPAFSRPPLECVVEPDPAYRFDPVATLAILAGFAHNRRVLLHGLHGTGKSTHVEQVAARLNWPCLRLNLDGDVGRLELLGRDVITLCDGQQVTAFQDGLLPWALRRPVALVIDEYDAGRADVMFVLQRMLEADGCLTLLERNEVVRPHPGFRLFATANTAGLGDATGLYPGTQRLNQGQLDRWNLVVALDHPAPAREIEIVAARTADIAGAPGGDTLAAMVRMAGLTRAGFRAGDVTTLMSPRTLIDWAHNTAIFGDLDQAFVLTFLNKCDDSEHATFAEYYQRCFDQTPAAA